MLAEDGVVEHDLLQELDQLVGKVCCHEGLDRDRHLLWVLGLRQSRLHHLRGGNMKGKTEEHTLEGNTPLHTLPELLDGLPDQ